MVWTLINQCTNFQFFNIQIPENFFSKMLKAWIFDNFLHIRWKIKVNFILTSFVFEKAEENVYKYQNSLGDVLDMKNLHFFGIKNQKTLINFNDSLTVWKLLFVLVSCPYFLKPIMILAMEVMMQPTFLIFSWQKQMAITQLLYQKNKV